MTGAALRDVQPPVREIDPLEGTVVLVIGFLGLIAVTLGSAFTTAGDVAALVGVLVVLALTAPRTTIVGAALLTAAGWGLLTGFVVNRYGELTFAPSDLRHLAALVGVVTLAFGVGQTSRLVRGRWSARGHRRSASSASSAGSAGSGEAWTDAAADAPTLMLSDVGRSTVRGGGGQPQSYGSQGMSTSLGSVTTVPASSLSLTR